MTTYTFDRTWADAYIPALRHVVGPLLVTEAPLDQDMRQATDLIIFNARGLTIGCRVRRPGYVEKYGWQFTIRSERESGARTELSKIIDGWPDWYVYAHAADDPIPRLERWFVLDMDVFRAQIIRSGALRKKILDKPIANGDGTYFIAFELSEFPTSLIISASQTVPRAA